MICQVDYTVEKTSTYIQLLCLLYAHSSEKVYEFVRNLVHLYELTYSYTGFSETNAKIHCSASTFERKMRTVHALVCRSRRLRSRSDFRRA